MFQLMYTCISMHLLHLYSAMCVRITKKWLRFHEQNLCSHFWDITSAILYLYICNKITLPFITPGFKRTATMFLNHKQQASQIELELGTDQSQLVSLVGYQNRISVYFHKQFGFLHPLKKILEGVSKFITY